MKADPLPPTLRRKLRRALFPFALLALLLAVGCSEDSNPAGDDSGDSPGSFVEQMESELLRLTNVERSGEGLEPLAEDSALVIVARRHSEDMAERDFFAHENPDGEQPWDRFTRYSDRQFLFYAENIFMGSGFEGSVEGGAATIVEAWMESPGHRANILAEEPTHLGCGVSLESGVLHATQNFAAFP
jgi:uncharacterized protein YkwD